MTQNKTGSNSSAPNEVKASDIWSEEKMIKLKEYILTKSKE